MLLNCGFYMEYIYVQLYWTVYWNVLWTCIYEMYCQTMFVEI